MGNEAFGANEFVFTGDRTTVTFFPVTPGPIQPGHEGGELHYQGPLGDHTFHGDKITKADTLLGTLLTVVLQPNLDAGGIDFTVFVPTAIGVTRDQPVTFATIGIQSSTRGFI